MKMIDYELLRGKITAMQSTNPEYAYNFLNNALNPSTEWECIEDMIDSIEVYEAEPVKRGRWIEKAEDYYKSWQDSGRSWDDMPYFVTGLKFACSNCFEQFDNYVEGVEKWNGCPICFAKMEGAENEKT